MEKLEIGRFAGMNMHYSYYGFNYFLDAMVKYQVKNIEIWAGNPHLYPEDLTINDIRKMRKDIEGRGLNLVCYTPETLFYPINLALDQENGRQRSIRYCIKHLETASELGAPYMLITAGRGYYNEDIKEAWKRSSDALSIIARQAEELGVVLLLEALQYEESNIVTSIPTIKKMLAEVNSPFMQTMIDTVQMTVAGETIDQYFAELGDSIRHVHFTEGAPAGHLTWGDGNLPMKQFIREFEKNNYEGYLTLEIGPYWVNPDKAIEQALKLIRENL